MYRNWHTVFSVTHTASASYSLEFWCYPPPNLFPRCTYSMSPWPTVTAKKCGSVLSRYVYLRANIAASRATADLAVVDILPFQHPFPVYTCHEPEIHRTKDFLRSVSTNKSDYQNWRQSQEPSPEMSQLDFFRGTIRSIKTVGSVSSKSTIAEGWRPDSPHTPWLLSTLWPDLHSWKIHNGASWVHISPASRAQWGSVSHSAVCCIGADSTRQHAELTSYKISPDAWIP